MNTESESNGSQNSDGASSDNEGSDSKTSGKDDVSTIICKSLSNYFFGSFSHLAFLHTVLASPQIGPTNKPFEHREVLGLY